MVVVIVFQLWVVLCSRCGSVCLRMDTHHLTHSYMRDDVVGRALYRALPTKKYLMFSFFQHKQQSKLANSGNLYS